MSILTSITIEPSCKYCDGELKFLEKTVKVENDSVIRTHLLECTKCDVVHEITTIRKAYKAKAK